MRLMESTGGLQAAFFRALLTDDLFPSIIMRNRDLRGGLMRTVLVILACLFVGACAPYTVEQAAKSSNYDLCIYAYGDALDSTPEGRAIADQEITKRGLDCSGYLEAHKKNKETRLKTMQQRPSYPPSYPETMRPSYPPGYNVPYCPPGQICR